MSNKSITLRFDDKTCELLEECARTEERDVAQQARYFVKRGLDQWIAAQREADSRDKDD